MLGDYIFRTTTVREAASFRSHDKNQKHRRTKLTRSIHRPIYTLYRRVVFPCLYFPAAAPESCEKSNENGQ